MALELDYNDLVARLMEAGWNQEDAEAEARRNFEGEYDETDGT